MLHWSKVGSVPGHIWLLNLVYIGKEQRKKGVGCGNVLAASSNSKVHPAMHFGLW